MSACRCDSEWVPPPSGPLIGPRAHRLPELPHFDFALRISYWGMQKLLDGARMDFATLFLRRGRVVTARVKSSQDSQPRAVYNESQLHDPDHVPVVLIHGLGANRGYWAKFAEKYSSDRAVVALDMPGCGRNESLRFTPDAASGYIIDQMNELGVRKFDLVGHSLGGLVALDTAARAPGRVSNVVLLDAHLISINEIIRSPRKFFCHPVAGTALLLLLVGLLVPGRSQLSQLVASSPLLSRLMLRLLFYSTENLDLVRLKKAFARNRNKGVMSALRAIRSFRSATPPETTRVSLIWGENDRLLSAHDRTAAQQRFCLFAEESIARCGHLPMIERPDELATRLRDVCDRT